MRVVEAKSIEVSSTLQLIDKGVVDHISTQLIKAMATRMIMAQADHRDLPQN